MSVSVQASVGSNFSGCSLSTKQRDYRDSTYDILRFWNVVVLNQLFIPGTNSRVVLVCRQRYGRLRFARSLMQLVVFATFLRHYVFMAFSLSAGGMLLCTDQGDNK